MLDRSKKLTPAEIRQYMQDYIASHNITDNANKELLVKLSMSGNIKLMSILTSPVVLEDFCNLAYEEMLTSIKPESLENIETELLNMLIQSRVLRYMIEKSNKPYPRFSFNAVCKASKEILPFLEYAAFLDFNNIKTGKLIDATTNYLNTETASEHLDRQTTVGILQKIDDGETYHFCNSIVRDYLATRYLNSCLFSMDISIPDRDRQIRDDLFMPFRHYWDIPGYDSAREFIKTNYVALKDRHIWNFISKPLSADKGESWTQSVINNYFEELESDRELSKKTKGLPASSTKEIFTRLANGEQLKSKGYKNEYAYLNMAACGGFAALVATLAFISSTTTPPTTFAMRTIMMMLGIATFGYCFKKAELSLRPGL